MTALADTRERQRENWIWGSLSFLHLFQLPLDPSLIRFYTGRYSQLFRLAAHPLHRRHSNMNSKDSVDIVSVLFLRVLAFQAISPVLRDLNSTILY
jgi:hypothetical protein